LLLKRKPKPENSMKRTTSIALAAAVWFGATFSQAQTMVNLYVGIDGREVLASGTYRGLPNPNYGRLTLLYAHFYPYGEFHRNHYHPIGAYSYTGPTNAPTILDTSSGNAIPEVYTGLPGITLVPGTNGVWLGKLMSRKTKDHYSDLRIRSVHSLSSYGVGSAERAMYLSSGGTRTNLMTGAILALELLSKSEGLNIADTNGAPILQAPGDRQIIGHGEDFNFEYLPVFWVPDNAEPGDYQAEFRLVDINTDGGRTPFPPSGRFFFKFRVAAPPTLAIARTVTLTLPLVNEGWVLEAAPTVNGPWNAIPFPQPPDTTYSQSGTTYEGTLPLTVEHQFFRLVRR